MSVGLLLALAFGGLLLTAFTATGVHVFHEFSHYELEQYCRRKNQARRFDQIVTWHEKWTLAAEGLRALGATLTVLAGSIALFQLGRVDERVYSGQFIAALLLGTLLLLVTTSWIPWAVARLWSAPFLFHTWRIWFVSGRLAWPLTIGVGVVVAFFRRMAGDSGQTIEVEEAWEEEVRAIVMTGERGGLVESDLREMIEGVIELDKLAISEIMTPRSKVDAIDIAMPFEQILNFVIQVGRTRLPVFEEQFENVIGVLFVKDLLPEITKSDAERSRSMRPLLRDPWFVPESKSVDSMLKDFLEERNHLAIVLDEYHNVAGVITIEDVLEEIVGEIMDESDQDEEVDIVPLNDYEYDVLATAHVDEINERIGCQLPESDEFSTIAGFVLNEIGEIPRVGKKLHPPGLEIEVTEASRRAIQRLRLRLPAKASMSNPDKEAV